jgi:cytoskeletal protein CcmA (bactofilin family)
MSAQSVTLEGARISGNIKAAASVLIHQDTILIGDIAAQTIEVSGKVKGNLLVNEDVKLTNGAYVLGDIAARSISVDSGAIIAGAIKLQVAENVGDPFQIEPQNKSLAKEKKKIEKT